MDLVEGARQWVLRNLPYDKSDTQLDTYLNGMDAHKALVIYRNWMSRLIRPTPRQVHISQSLQTRLSQSRHAAVVRHIVSDIEQGANLKPYLSKLVNTAVQVPTTPKKLNRRNDLDLLLTDWGMHHLHLSTTVGPNGFVTRTADLLFAVFRPRDAYLIDIEPHRSWTKKSLIQILHKELPGAKATHVLRGVAGLSYEPTEEEHQQLRNAGGGIAIMIDDEAVWPGGGISTAGTSMMATKDADRLLDQLEAFEEAWEERSKEVRSSFASSGVILPEMPAFEFVCDQTGPGIFEATTKALVRL